MRKGKVVAVVALSLVLIMTTVISGLAQPWAKEFSTNFTLVNLGTGAAKGVINYVLTDGSAWGGGSEAFSIADVGGQAIFRQYADPGDPGNPNLTSDRGSVVVESDMPLGAVVQIQARGQNPTSNGAYSGFTNTDSTFIVPLVARKKVTASGTGSSQVIVQNTGTVEADIEIEMVNKDGSSRHSDTKNDLQPGASYYYDLDLESSSNVPDNWIGSAVVSTATPNAALAVVSNFFTGDAMQTFNGFGATSPDTKWFVPLFTSRLGNSLSTPIAVQNYSGGTLAIDDVTVDCNPDPARTDLSPFTLTNGTAIDDTAAFYFNPVVDTSIPEKWQGSCVVEAADDVVVFVQMRFIDAGEAAAYEGIPGIPDTSANTTAYIPLVAKRLGNGFATAVTIQNLTDQTATFDLTYIPSSDYGGSSSPVEITGVTVGPYESLIQNHRTTDGVSALPEKWFGSLVVESDYTVGAFVQLTFVRSINPGIPGGDTFMAHNAFTQ
ncbi:hypothetical protein ACFLT5_03320 [Chloroflexota bacterium]